MTTFIKVTNPGHGSGGHMPLRCPACHRDGSFAPISNIPDLNMGGQWLGHRVCPNPGCRCHVFVIRSGNAGHPITFPAERIDFDASSIPPTVVAVFEEALSCHANACFVASGMLVRKTLENLCDDRGAQGKDLKDRIADLRRVVILPEALFQALDGIRLLGNDAAHVRAKTYTEIGKDEIEVAIALTKEVLKAVYQYDALLARLNALKK